MASQSSVIRLVAGCKKHPLGSLRLRLRVTPGASRQGIAAVTDEAVQVRVAAQPRDGEANDAVVQVLSEALGIPKSELELSHGLRSRDKIAVLGVVSGEGEEYAAAVLGLLRRKIGR